MDGNSIITQVARDSATTNIHSTEVENIKPFKNTFGSHKKKTKRQSIFKTLLCCFTTHQDENKHTPENDNNCLISNNDKYLLPQIRTHDIGKKCLIIDLDETLVHSSFKPVSNADFIVPVEIEGATHQVYVLKRPYVDDFLKKMGELFECVLFTASLAKYADPVADLLDKWNVFRTRLFREACVYYRGNYVKDLSKLGRELSNIIICDNSPASYIFHPDNAVPVSSWFDDPNDTELMDLIPFMEKLAHTDDIYSILKHGNLDTVEKTIEEASTNTVYIQQAQKMYSDQNTVHNNHIDRIKVDQSLLINQQSSFDHEYVNSGDDNNDENYTLNETSIVLSMDITSSSLSKYQRHNSEATSEQ